MGAKKTSGEKQLFFTWCFSIHMGTQVVGQFVCNMISLIIGSTIYQNISCSVEHFSLLQLEQPLPARPTTSDRPLDLLKIHDVTPISFRLPGETKTYAVKSGQDLTNIERRMNRLKVVICQCTEAHNLKMIFERALIFVGLDQQLEVPTVDLKHEMEQCTFSSEKNDGKITDVIKSVHDKVAISLSKDKSNSLCLNTLADGALAKVDETLEY